MPSLDSISSLRIANSLGGMPVYIPFAFTTNGSGVPTLRDSYGGLVTIASGGTNNRTVTITFPKWVRTLSCVWSHDQSALINFDRTLSASAGTLVLAASADFFSGEVEGILCVSQSNVD
jgi:hypothetical protein